MGKLETLKTGRPTKCTNISLGIGILLHFSVPTPITE